jgi:hypothetical protein
MPPVLLGGAHTGISEDHRRKNQRTIFKTSVTTTLTTMQVTTGKPNENPGRSIRMSPGRLPNGSPGLLTSHKTNPSAATARPQRIIHFAREERSITLDPFCFHMLSAKNYYTTAGH